MLQLRLFLFFFSLELSHYQLIPAFTHCQGLFKNQDLISLTAAIAAFIISILSINLFYQSRQRMENELKQSVENEMIIIEQEKVNLALLEKETKEKTHYIYLPAEPD